MIQYYIFECSDTYNGIFDVCVGAVNADSANEAIRKFMPKMYDFKSMYTIRGGMAVTKNVEMFCAFPAHQCVFDDTTGLKPFSINYKSENLRKEWKSKHV